MQKLTLYYRPTCPYCRKVLSFIEGKNIALELKNISENNVFEKELITLGGKRQVPCLVIDGNPKYESDDIIHWLEGNSC